jgi:2-polyprenyl-3-methyl-5-hydroxy-6-metoxy-1,4-benzoquinol methylase
MNFDKTNLQPETLQLLEYAESNIWPEAVQSFLICGENNEEKFDRAEGIVDYIDENISGKKFLDFGCGEGHVPYRALKHEASLSVGYDLQKTGNFEWDSENSILFSNLSSVESMGPFDVILLYDVLDHCQAPINLLNTLKSCSHAETKIFVRCHSWMSRHGSHLYRQFNKAWAHLIFAQDELKSLGLDTDIVQKYFYPIGKQKEWFKQAQMTVVQESFVKSVIESFFYKPEITKRLPLNEFQGKFPEFQMSQTFNDYILKLQ